MKIRFLLPLLLMAPVAASAQPKPTTRPTAPQISVEPAAQTLLDTATATYQNAEGVRFASILTRAGEVVDQSSVAFQRPNLLRLESRNGKKSQLIQSDGSREYLVNQIIRGRYQKGDASDSCVQHLGQTGLLGSLIAGMLAGHTPIEFASSMPEKPFDRLKLRVVMVPSQVMDGVAMRGVRLDCSYVPLHRSRVASPRVINMTLWFSGAGALLQRVQWDMPLELLHKESWQKLSAQELNPTLPPDTFRFDATGLKPITNEEIEKHIRERVLFDPRLKVGAQPFAFSARALNGQTISPANYKGKVLILDFWATWCGPCVESLPGVQTVYDKYHARGLEVVGISLDENPNDVKVYTRGKKLVWPEIVNGKDPRSDIAKLYGVQGIPFLLLIGRDGKIASVNTNDFLADLNAGDDQDSALAKATARLDAAVQKALAAR